MGYSNSCAYTIILKDSKTTAYEPIILFCMHKKFEETKHDTNWIKSHEKRRIRTKHKHMSQP